MPSTSCKIFICAVKPHNNGVALIVLIVIFPKIEASKIKKKDILKDVFSCSFIFWPCWYALFLLLHCIAMRDREVGLRC